MLGHGFDWADQPLLDASFHWSSDIQGLLAQGSTATTTALTAGVHHITLHVTDNRNQITTATADLTITTRPAPGILGFTPSELPTVRADAWAVRAAYHGNPVPYIAQATDIVDGPLSVTVTSNLDGFLFSTSPTPMSSMNGLYNGPSASTSYTTHEMQPAVHVLTASVTNSVGLTASTTYGIEVLAMEPRAFDPSTRWDSYEMDLDVAPSFIEDYTPHVGMYNSFSPPYYRVTTGTVGVRSRIYGHPTTVTVNDVICPTTYDGISATLSATTVSLVTGTNDIVIRASRGTYTVTATHHIIYKLAAANHLPTVEDISLSKLYPGGMLRVDYMGRDEEWDFCTPYPEFSVAPASTATEGDWFEAGPTGTCYAVTWLMCSRPYYFPNREFAPRERFLFDDPNYFYTTVPGTMPGTQLPNGMPGYAWYEGPIWMRVRAHDGIGYGPYTTVTTAIPYDSIPPRGATDLQVVSQSTGQLTVGWTPAEDLNFDTYSLTVDYTDRWENPPKSKHLVIDKAIESSLSSTSTTQYTFTSIPPDVTVYVTLYAKDTFGNITGGQFGTYCLLERTTSDILGFEVGADVFNPAPNPYRFATPASLPCTLTLATSATITARVYLPNPVSVIRTIVVTGVPGANELEWDGRTEAGILVIPGEYAIRTETSRSSTPVSTSNAIFFRVAY
jgi:hypothetical protein